MATYIWPPTTSDHCLYMNLSFFLNPNPCHHNSLLWDKTKNPVAMQNSLLCLWTCKPLRNWEGEYTKVWAGWIKNVIVRKENSVWKQSGVYFLWAKANSCTQPAVDDTSRARQGCQKRCDKRGIWVWYNRSGGSDQWTTVQMILYQLPLDGNQCKTMTSVPTYDVGVVPGKKSVRECMIPENPPILHTILYDCKH